MQHQRDSGGTSERKVGQASLQVSTFTCNTEKSPGNQEEIPSRIYLSELQNKTKGK